MDLHTLSLVGFAVLAAATLFVRVRVRSAAAAVDDANGELDDRASADEIGEGGSVDHDDTERPSGSRLTAEDRERIRRYLETDRSQRCPDDLLPSDDDRS